MVEVDCACAAPSYIICGPGPYRADGCGHAYADHTNGLRCRICGTECGHLERRPRARCSSTPGVQLTLDTVADPGA